MTSDGSVQRSNLGDVHNHLLPRVDDGSQGIVETLRYLAEFVSQGVGTVAFTPHLVLQHLSDPAIDHELVRHRSAFAALEHAIEPTDRVPDLLLAQEIHARFPEDIARVLDRTDIGYGDGRYLLIEFGFSPWFDGDGVIEAVHAHGRSIVVAHPEHYDYSAQGDPLDTARRWADAGAVLQVNAGSVLGLYTEEGARIARDLLEGGLAHVIGTDHHGDSRPCEPGRVFDALVEMLGVEAARVLMSDNPHRIYAGEAVIEPPGTAA